MNPAFLFLLLIPLIPVMADVASKAPHPDPVGTMFFSLLIGVVAFLMIGMSSK